MKTLPCLPEDPCDDDDDDDEMTGDVTQKKTKYKRCMFFFQHRRLH